MLTKELYKYCGVLDLKTTTKLSSNLYYSSTDGGMHLGVKRFKTLDTNTKTLYNHIAILFCLKTLN